MPHQLATAAATIAAALRRVTRGLSLLPVPDLRFEARRRHDLRLFLSVFLAIQLGYAAFGALTGGPGALARDRSTAIAAGAAFFVAAIVALVVVRRARRLAVIEVAGFVAAVLSLVESLFGQLADPVTAPSVATYESIAIAVMAFALPWQPITHLAIVLVAIPIALTGLTVVTPLGLHDGLLGALVFACLIALVSKPLVWNARIEGHLASMRTRASRAALAEAQRIARVGSWTYDPSARRVEYSDELRRILVLARTDGVSTSDEFVGFFSAESAAHLRDGVAASVATGRPLLLEADLTLRDGAVRRVSIAGERAASGGRIVVRGSLADITELHDAQEQVDLAQRAELVGRLAAGVAHDFNNSLVSIRGYAEFLHVALPAGDPRRPDVQGILDAVSMAADQVRQLLAFGRRQVIRPEPLDVGALVEDLGPLLRRLCGPAITVEIRPCEGPCYVRADRSLIEQVVANLALNARDAMMVGGRLTIVVSRISGDAAPAGQGAAAAAGYVRVAVSDTGTGIDPAFLPHVFEPFFTTKELGRGSGLGLSSVEGATAQSGGFVTVESDPGRGTTFAIHLPAIDEAPPASASSRNPSAEQREPGEPPPPGSVTILLVDDEPLVLLVVARLLRELGYVVLDAERPATALAIAEARTAPIDLLLTDVTMPQMNGRELADRLRSLFPGLPVVYMSAYAAETVLADGTLPGTATILSKPFTTDELVATLGVVLARGPEMPAG